MQKEHSPDIIQSIDDYLNGKLDSSQIDALWARMMQQPEYFHLLETQAAMKKIQVPDFREKLESGYNFFPDEDESGRSQVRENRVVWAGALAAVVVITLLLNVFRSTVETELSPAIAQIHASQLIAPDVSRSSTENMTDLERGLYRAYLLSVSGNQEGAKSEYEMLAGHGEPGLSWIRYNLAIVHYNAGDYHASAGYFRQVDCSMFEEPGRTESCYWFKTNSLVAAGDLEQAWEAGNRTLDQSGYYQDDAIELLRKIRYVLDQRD